MNFFLSLSMLLFLILVMSRIPQSNCQEESERQILLQMKASWGSPPPALASWNSTTSSNHCSWFGITCTNNLVTQISLSNQNISLPIPDAVCRLKNLTYLDVSDNEILSGFPRSLYSCSALQFLNISQNYFFGSLPDDIHKLSRALQFLNISQNFFVGSLPDDIHKLPPTLTVLDLSENNFTGVIPASVGRLLGLKEIHLEANSFNGTYPKEIANLYNLEHLSLSWNTLLKPAPILDEFGNLTKLRNLWMARTNTIGEIPVALSKLTKLEHLDLGWNQINGTVPSWIWSLENLDKLYLYANQLGEIDFTGPIRSLRLSELDLSLNKFTGAIPESIGELKNLSTLLLYYNLFSSEIPVSIGFLPKLRDFRLFGNNLTGPLPENLGNYSKLWNLEVDDNRLSGKIPPQICSGKNLETLILFNNDFSGEVPSSLADCDTLQSIQLFKNRFSGEFPSKIWSITNLVQIMIHDNDFSGTLPKNLSRNLNRIEIENNHFTGEIPSFPDQLQVLRASNNSFHGKLPLTLSSLQELSLGSNQITGYIPYKMFDSLSSLSILDLSHNQLTRPIPPSIGVLPVLMILDLSENHLSGPIPIELTNLTLNFLNLSVNQLTGTVPSAFYVEPFSQSFLSNLGLCTLVNTVLSLPLCDNSSENAPEGPSYSRDMNILKRSKRLSKWLIAFVVVGCAAFIGTIIIGLHIAREHRRRINNSLDCESWELTPFSTLDFTESDILNGLVEDNLIGRGGSGTVYKIDFRNSAAGSLAVKKIWSGQRPEPKLEKQFQAEAQILGSMRHANIVKLLCCIASAQTKLLVYEYMENSSLDRWLHGKGRLGNWTPLDWPTRLQIAIGAARGLCYMHHDCSPPIVHRDVKSSNILLDPQFKAKIADFGLARVLLKAGEPETVSAIAGSYGYIAPEYEYTQKINQKVDVYSFGVVLLELTTARRANGGDHEHSFLADWAWHRFQERDSLLDVIDEHIRDEIYLDQVAQVFRLGLVCTAKLPPSRPSMKEVLRCLTRCEEPDPQGHALRGEYEVARLFCEQNRRGEKEREREREREIEMMTVATEDGETFDFSVHVVSVPKH